MPHRLRAEPGSSTSQTTVKSSVSEFRVLDWCLREGTYSVLDPCLGLVERLICCLLKFTNFLVCNLSDRKQQKCVCNFVCIRKVASSIPDGVIGIFH